MINLSIAADGEIPAEAEIDLICKAFSEEFKGDDSLSVELLFVSDGEIRELNARSRNVDAVTDVLSFPAFDGLKSALESGVREEVGREDGVLLIGSIVIDTAQAERQAKEFGHSLGREINYLTVHGLCHLMGYDHIEEQEKKSMREKEEAILKRMNLERTE